MTFTATRLPDWPGHPDVSPAPFMYQLVYINTGNRQYDPIANPADNKTFVWNGKTTTLVRGPVGNVTDLEWASGGDSRYYWFYEKNLDGSYDRWGSPSSTAGLWCA